MSDHDGTTKRVAPNPREQAMDGCGAELTASSPREVAPQATHLPVAPQEFSSLVNKSLTVLETRKFSQQAAQYMSESERRCLFYLLSMGLIKGSPVIDPYIGYYLLRVTFRRLQIFYLEMREENKLLLFRIDLGTGDDPDPQMPPHDPRMSLELKKLAWSAASLDTTALLAVVIQQARIFSLERLREFIIFGGVHARPESTTGSIFNSSQIDVLSDEELTHSMMSDCPVPNDEGIAIIMLELLDDITPGGLHIQRQRGASRPAILLEALQERSADGLVPMIALLRQSASGRLCTNTARVASRLGEVEVAPLDDALDERAMVLTMPLAPFSSVRDIVEFFRVRLSLPLTTTHGNSFLRKARTLCPSGKVVHVLACRDSLGAASHSCNIRQKRYATRSVILLESLRERSADGLVPMVALSRQSASGRLCTNTARVASRLGEVEVAPLDDALDERAMVLTMPLAPFSSVRDIVVFSRVRLSLPLTTTHGNSFLRKARTLCPSGKVVHVLACRDSLGAASHSCNIRQKRYATRSVILLESLRERSADGLVPMIALSRQSASGRPPTNTVRVASRLGEVEVAIFDQRHADAQSLFMYIAYCDELSEVAILSGRLEGIQTRFYCKSNRTLVMQFVRVNHARRIRRSELAASESRFVSLSGINGGIR